MFVRLKIRDRLPMVAYGQWLLGRHPALSDHSLSIDGMFGPQTADAVRAVQEAESVRVTGELTRALWRILRLGLNEHGHVIESLAIGTTNPKRGAGGVEENVLADRDYLADDDPNVSIIVQAGSSFGLPTAIDRLLETGRIGRCVLLRFHGHGDRGYMVVTGSGALRSEFTPTDSRGYRRELARLRPLFGPFGSIELHGCRVGSGPDGLRTLESLAEQTGVPVTAGYRAQEGGSMANRFEGPVRMVFPGPYTLRSWASAQVGGQCAAAM